VSWPIVTAAGGPRDRGRAYGAAARDRIHASVQLYDTIFAHYTGLAWAQVRRRGEAFAEPIDAYDVQLLPEIEGVAEGAGLDAEDVLALNLRTEIMFGLDARAARIAAKECTAVSAPSPGHAIHAQNWDWKPGARATCVLLAAAPHDRPGFVTLTEAGLLAKCGMNESGLALTANALVSSEDRGSPGVPFHAILRRVLTSTSLQEAEAHIVDAPRASSANYMVSAAGGASLNIEAGPGGPHTARVTRGPRLAHANHFLWNERPFKDLGRIDGEGSLRRQAVAEHGIDGEAGRDDIEALLRDHEGRPDSVCSHEDPSLPREEDYATIAAIIMTPDVGEIAVTEGNPCEAAFEAFDVAELVGRARAVPAPG
jgi:isopenicillin-N N-acyltransferase-like protein